MKTFVSLAAAAGFALALSFTGALAQAPQTTGTGSATQQDKPSAVGLSNPAGPPSAAATRPMMGKKMMMRKHHMRKHHRRMMKKKMM